MVSLVNLFPRVNTANASRTIALAFVLCAVAARGWAAAEASAPESGPLLHSRAAVTRVSIAEPTIVRENGAVPPYYSVQAQLLRLRDGSLLLAGASGRILRSTDGGETWVRQEDRLKDYILFQRRDGSFYVVKSRAVPTEKRGIFRIGRIQVANLDDLAAAGEADWRDISVQVERFKSTVGDDYKTVVTGPSVEPVLEMADGTMLALSYGNFVGDDIPIRGFNPKIGEAPMYRTYLLSSMDGGQSWSYLSTIAYDGVTGQESFCEASLVHFGNDELLAVMRTGRYSPMYQARSLDGGKTWGRPESLETLGLQPKMTLLQNGVLVCSFGWRPMKFDHWRDTDGGYYPAGLTDYRKRYENVVGIADPSAAAGDYVMFSPDKGHTWSAPRKIAEPLTQGYTQVAAVAPDACLVLSYRFALPGKSVAAIARIWEQESKDFLEEMRNCYEARRVTVIR